MSLLCGIDEAGRGAVLGPLVVAGVCIPHHQQDILRTLGVRDSKLLAQKKREFIFQEFEKRNIAFFYSLISPADIDNTSVNTLEIEHTSRIINALRPDEVFLDVPARGRGIDYYCQRVEKNLSEKPKLFGGNHFDTLHEIVGAASIVAKVMRERAVAELKKEYGDFGSGYPTQKTVAYIREHFTELRPIIRMKWRTIQLLAL